METTTFTALCESAGRWWTIHVPQIEGMTAQVRSLDQVELVTRQLIARTLSLAPDAIRINVVQDAPAPVAEALQKRYAARLAADAANAATRDALLALAHSGYAFHEAATVLGLSPAEIEVYGPAGGRTAPGSAAGPQLPRGRHTGGQPMLGRRGAGQPTAASGPLDLADQ
jgi:hypothetical protein